MHSFDPPANFVPPAPELGGTATYVVCPICGDENVHIKHTNYQYGFDASAANWWGRGDLAVLPMYCEQGCQWELCFGFHKGITYMFTRHNWPKPEYDQWNKVLYLPGVEAPLSKDGFYRMDSLMNEGTYAIVRPISVEDSHAVFQVLARENLSRDVIRCPFEDLFRYRFRQLREEDLALYLDCATDNMHKLLKDDAAPQSFRRKK